MCTPDSALWSSRWIAHDSQVFGGYLKIDCKKHYIEDAYTWLHDILLAFARNSNSVTPVMMCTLANSPRRNNVFGWSVKNGSWQQCSSTTGMKSRGGHTSANPCSCPELSANAVAFTFEKILKIWRILRLLAAEALTSNIPHANNSPPLSWNRWNNWKFVLDARPALPDCTERQIGRLQSRSWQSLDERVLQNDTFFPWRHNE